MVPKTLLTSYSRISGSRWVITPSWLSGLWRYFLYSRSMYPCHLFLIPSASSKSISFLSFIEPIFALNIPLASLISLKRSLVFPILLFSSISLHWSLRKALLLSLLFFGTLHSNGYIFPFLLCFCSSSFHSYVWMWQLDYKESWALKNWCIWTVVLENTLENHLNCKEILPVHPKGNQSWIFNGRADAEAQTPVLWPPDVKSWLTWKDPNVGKDWRQEEKGLTEDEMVGWHHRLNGHGFGWTPGVVDGQGGLVCCSAWGCKQLDKTEQLNWKYYLC